MMNINAMDYHVTEDTVAIMLQQVVVVAAMRTRTLIVPDIT